MTTLIRTHTFLKYARLNLQEAEAALQEGDLKAAASRCQDVAVALVKALAAATPVKRVDIEGLKEAQLRSIVSDLAETREQANKVIQGLLELLQGMKAEDRVKAEALYSRTGELFRAVHDICVPG